MEVVHRLVRRPLIRQQGKFLVVGVVSTILDFAAANVLAFVVALPNVIANAIAVSLVGTVNFALNRAWTFGVRGRVDVAREVAPFVAVTIGVIGLTSAVIWAAGALLGGGVLVFNAAKLAGLGLIFLAKFFVFRRWVFANRAAPQPE